MKIEDKNPTETEIFPCSLRGTVLEILWNVGGLDIMGKKFNNKMIQLEYSRKTRGIFGVVRYILGFMSLIAKFIVFDLVWAFISNLLP